LETIKVLNASSTMQQRWEQSSNFISHVNGRMRLVTQSTMSFTSLIQQLISIAVLVVGVYLLADGNATQGGLIAAVMLSSRALAPMAQVASLLTQFQNTKTSLSSLEQTMALPVERPAEANFLSRNRFDGQIEFRDVCFAYPGREQASINKVSFTIRRGERVGIIGRIGAGKTTLERLILGLYQPTEGTVLIDGIDMRQLDPAELRRAIGYVPQEPMLFYGSLRDNITLGVLDASDRAVVQAAEIAGVNEFADRHPKGYDMLIGERGESLSAGQRQAIAISRAILTKPPILLLDEPTSAMDFVSEDRLKSRLKPVLEQRTVILITHRTALLDYVDRILVLDNGRLVADGPREQVMAALRDGKVRGAN
jgi:ATP-binding cassette subfamily C protein LapB